MRTLAAAILMTISLVSTALAQPENPTTASLEGVWKVTKVVQAGVVNTNPQPGLLIFTRGYVLPPLKWSSLKYGFDQGGLDRWQGKDTQQKRLSRSYGRSMC
jgi:hypothetical protein